MSESRHDAVNIHDVTIDQPEISPYNIDVLENIVVMGIEYVIREERTWNIIVASDKNFTDLTNINTIFFFNSVLLIGLKLQIEISSNSFFL